MKTLIEYYDDFAQSWADRWYSNETLLPYLKEFIQYLPKCPRVLDLCCGAGYESMRLNNLGAEVVGIDLSEKSIEIAKSKNPDIEFYVKDMLNSYRELGLFDGVICVAGLVHINEQNLQKAFKNMHEILKNNGYLLIVVQDGTEITTSVEIEGKQYARQFFCYTLEKIMQYSKDYFTFEKEIFSDTKWKYYILKRQR